MPSNIVDYIKFLLKTLLIHKYRLTNHFRIVQTIKPHLNFSFNHTYCSPIYLSNVLLLVSTDFAMPTSLSKTLHSLDPTTTRYPPTNHSSTSNEIHLPVDL